LREHWSARQRRTREQRQRAHQEMLAHFGCVRPELPLVVTLTRFWKGRPLDDDNLRGALKAQRDGIADYFGIDDADARITFEYAQEKGRPGLQIEIQPP
jgi:hypothetical protein